MLLSNLQMVLFLCTPGVNQLELWVLLHLGISLWPCVA